LERKKGQLSSYFQPEKKMRLLEWWKERRLGWAVEKKGSKSSSLEKGNAYYSAERLQSARLLVPGE